MTTWGNKSKNSSSWGNKAKSDPSLSKQLLEIGDGFNLLIDSTYKLEIQAAISSTTWGNVAKS